jgi:hypothetical protein
MTSTTDLIITLNNKPDIGDRTLFSNDEKNLFDTYELGDKFKLGISWKNVINSKMFYVIFPIETPERGIAISESVKNTYFTKPSTKRSRSTKISRKGGTQKKKNHRHRRKSVRRRH